MAKPVHSMIRVLDEARGARFLRRAPSGSKSPIISNFPIFALIYLRHPSSPFEVELTVNYRSARSLTWLGDGYGHLAVVVDNVDPRARALRTREIIAGSACAIFKHDGRTLARFFFVSDPDGYKIEVIQKGRTVRFKA